MSEYGKLVRVILEKKPLHPNYHLLIVKKVYVYIFYMLNVANSGLLYWLECIYLFGKHSSPTLTRRILLNKRLYFCLETVNILATSSQLSCD